jgi:hypothetical protein
MTATKTNISLQGNVQFDKAMEKFFEEIYVAIERHINFDVVKVLLVGRYPTVVGSILLLMLVQSRIFE